METSFKQMEDKTLLRSLIFGDTELYLYNPSGLLIGFDLFYNGNLIFHDNGENRPDWGDFDIDYIVDILCLLIGNRHDIDPEYYTPYTLDQKTWAESSSAKVIYDNCIDYQLNGDAGMYAESYHFFSKYLTYYIHYDKGITEG